MIRSVEHVAIAAKDTAGLARWYCETLGFRVVQDGGPGGIWFVGPPDGGALVEIVPANEAPRREHTRSDAGFSHLAFTITDFDAVCESLKAKGVQFTGPMTGGAAQPGQPGERRLAFFLDAEGNTLQIVQRPQPLGS